MRTLQLNHAISGWKRLPALLLCAAALLSVQSLPASAQQPDDPVATRKGAAEWLDRIQQAAQQQSYEGTFVYQRGGYVQSSRIAHVASRDGEFERIETLDGKPRKVLRHNDELYTFVPERKLCVVERRQTRDSFPSLLGAGGDHVMSVYDAKLLGKDRVAGLDAQVVELVPKDAYRFTYKLWSDARTGLLLRSQTLDAADHVLEQIAFSQVQTGGTSGDKAAIAAGMRNLSGWTVVRPPVATVDMEAQGWQIAPNVAGFRKIREVRRPMAARDAGDPPIPVDQAVFTDGLATISVFIEPAEKNTRKEGAGSTGATHVLVKRRGDYWITVLGEVPPATLQQFAAAIEYKASK
ncbi:MucB/RseB C-terminal domain-containing protein [Burkholderia ambifaria]|uniref:Sigma E regulatory protein, MucB/RseB n=1 Tax=Burkholderia ambifaria (strain MC40-6) TaxID=398577 RepID=B1YVL9_BURA4|nr:MULTISPECIES: MucB/RseB C-terminal domain-containing protein [Burkholderia]ACB63500.1 sigma E regulatory protein, MucB/RseB [Burkholderia ambifaria MC40-6]MBR8061729.1 MucB/RseB C-terminal domain-containing protein [Burkholderia ambifaria]MBR8174893.1 MucB/RseB C-terminal domain-containing protein [Burkholderia ambifaria]MBR8253291.1 MucB/RseB C-terminal domain-containing protein [Burkholderia ambifaria]MBY4768233.1 MucB/RseB C-terminal domain-containing protein [Burkholderia ambifaria]